MIEGNLEQSTRDCHGYALHEETGVATMFSFYSD